jgi:hypothetical protein
MMKGLGEVENIIFQPQLNNRGGAGGVSPLARYPVLGMNSHNQLLGQESS